MADHLDFSLQVRNTVIQVVYGDITCMEVDALVSSDDVHLSGASGLSRTIREAAGVHLNADIRKFDLPQPLGRVIVTESGRLPTKYIFHTTTISFDQAPRFDTLIPALVRRVLEISALLNVERLAMPMVNAGLVSVPPDVILRVIVEGSCCFLANTNSPVRHIVLAVYDDKATDHAAAEAQFGQQLAAVQADMRRWQETTGPLNERLRLLQPVLDQTVDDPELRQVVATRIATAEAALMKLFNCPQSLLDAPSLLGATARVGGAPSNRDEYLKAKQRLDTLLANLQQDIDHLTKVQGLQKDRFDLLELTAARKGIDTPVDIQSELEDLQTTITNRDHEIDRLESQLEVATQQRDMLMQHWGPSDAQPPASASTTNPGPMPAPDASDVKNAPQG